MLEMEKKVVCVDFTRFGTKQTNLVVCDRVRVNKIYYLHK